MRITFGRKMSDMLKVVIEKAEDMTLAETKAMARDTLAYASKISPQFTGTFASNWRLSINREATTGFRARVGRKRQGPSDPAKQEGDEPAVGLASNSIGSKLSGLKLGDSIYLAVRAVGEDGQEYHWDIESGRINFRSVNPTAKRSKGQIRELARQYLRAKYAGKIR